MISLVVCSIHANQLARLKKSVESTIGVPHEWLVADNRDTGKGICQVYNELAAAAQFPFLLFVHEDVSFSDAGWGSRVLSFFERDDRLGLVGVAGATIKSRSLSGWYTGNPRYDRYRLIHALPDHQETLDQLPANEPEPFKVVCLDGVFLFCRRSVWASIRFEQTHVRGFHFYDLDFSLRVAEKFGVGVLSSVGLTHHTAGGGDYGSRWVREAIGFHRRWQRELPRALLSEEVDELSIQKTWLDRLKDQSISIADRWNWIRSQHQLSRPVLYYSLLKFFLYRPLRLRYLHRYLRFGKTGQ